MAGRPVNALVKNKFSTTSQLLVDYLFSYYNSDHNGIGLGTSNNIAFPTNRLKRIGGFDTKFFRPAAEDREICDRWSNHGYSMVFAPEAVVYHYHRLDFWGFMRQHFNYGIGAYVFHRNRSPDNRVNIKPEPIRFYLDLIRYPSRCNSGAGMGKITVLLILSQIANAVGFFIKMMEPEKYRVGPK